MRTIFLVTAVLLSSAAPVQWATERTAPCALLVLRDYDFYYYYYAQLFLNTSCGDNTTVLQVRKVSNALVGVPRHPLNVWPKGSAWLVSQRGDTVPTRFQLTNWDEHWEYRQNGRSPWRVAVVR